MNIFSKLKDRFSSLILPALATVLILPAAAWAQTFSLSDLAGEWSIFVYGAYDAYTESAYGDLSLDQEGRVTGGTGLFRGSATAFRSGRVTLSAEGAAGGSITCSQVTWRILSGRMSQRKTNLTMIATGARSYVLIRLVKASGEPAGEGEPAPGGVARWSVYTEACCPEGGELTFAGTLDQETKSSVSYDCPENAFWDDYTETPAGPHQAFSYAVTGCGFEESGRIDVSLEAGRCHYFLLREDIFGWWIEVVVSGGCTRPYGELSPEGVGRGQGMEPGPPAAGGEIKLRRLILGREGPGSLGPAPSGGEGGR